MCETARIEGDLYFLACLPGELRKMVKPMYGPSLFPDTYGQVYEILMENKEKTEVTDKGQRMFDNLQAAIQREDRRPGAELHRRVS